MEREIKRRSARLIIFRKSETPRFSWQSPFRISNKSNGAKARRREDTTMARGGKRIGAGRPPGAINLRTRAIIEAALEGGETPFAYVLRVMRDEKAREVRRDDMAKTAVAYLSKISKQWDVDDDNEEPAAEESSSSETTSAETEVTVPTPLAETVE